MKTSENKNLAGEMRDLVDSLKERALASGVFDSLMTYIHEQIKLKAEGGLRILDTCNFYTNYQEAVMEEIIKALREEGFKVKLKHIWSFFSHDGNGYKYLRIKW